MNRAASAATAVLLVCGLSLGLDDGFAARHAHAAGGARSVAGDDAALARGIRGIAQPISGAAHDYDRLIEAIGAARIVMLGEDTHGTHEFYVERARITKRLIAEQGFAALVIESDLPPAARVSAVLEGGGPDAEIDAALRAFDRFPIWMWRNAEFTDLLRWIRDHNARRSRGMQSVQLRGMDLYELAKGASAVIGYLDTVDAAAASRARERYACFAPAGLDPQAYGSSLGVPGQSDCGAPAQAQLSELATLPDSFAASAGAAFAAPLDADPKFFDALQSARAVRNAEVYFRALYGNPDSSWNIRDAHMAASIDNLVAHLETAGNARPRIVVWAHNAHIGDARATARGAAGGWTLGQLLRERYPEAVFGVGFTTAGGTVHAATNWGESGVRKRLRTPLSGSHAALMRKTGLPRFYFTFGDSPFVRAGLRSPRPQRGIGVRYLPRLELAGHYYMSGLSEQFDALVHIDHTTALQPRINP